MMLHCRGCRVEEGVYVVQVPHRKIRKFISRGCSVENTGTWGIFLGCTELPELSDTRIKVVLNILKLCVPVVAWYGTMAECSLRY